MTSNPLNFSQHSPLNPASNVNDAHHQGNMIFTVNDSGRLESSSIPNSNAACTTQISGSELIDKIADVAIQNREVGLILAGAVGMAILIYAGGKAIAELIRASHV